MQNHLIVIAQQVVETPTTAFLKAGLLGAAVVALAAVVAYLWADGKKERKEKDETIQKLQDQRVADAKAVSEQMLKSTTECVTALTTAANALDAHRDMMGEVQKALIEKRR